MGEIDGLDSSMEPSPEGYDKGKDKKPEGKPLRAPLAYRYTDPVNCNHLYACSSPYSTAVAQATIVSSSHHCNSLFLSIPSPR